MGILDKVFSGSKGIVNILAGKLGGSATIIYVTKGVYNEDTDTYSETTSTLEVDVIPENRNKALTNDGNGIILDESDIVLTVPSCQIQNVPEAQKDFVRYAGNDYKISKIESNHVGNEIVTYRISGKR